jgi:hypothetical protein
MSNDKALGLARKNFGHVAAKLAELTDDVLLPTSGSGRSCPSATAASLPAPRWLQPAGPTR